jgi:hypothetical protein
MTTAHSRRGGRAVALVALFAGLALGLLSATSAPRAAAAPRAQKDDKAPKPPTTDHKLVGAAVCQDCHNKEEFVKDPPPEKLPVLTRQTQGNQFIRLWENAVWQGHDLHSVAYKNLLTSNTLKGKGVANATAERMEKNLRRSRGDEKYTVANDVACLACHASVSKAAVVKEPLKTWERKDFNTIDGVGCEMCHGHGSGYQQKHQESELVDNPPAEGPERLVPWREWAPTAKKEWGLIDLRDHVTATNQCASCHIGNLADGRFVTHEMYAAGHPPLPPLDLMAYSREQPRHWGLPNELPYFDKLLKKDAKKAEAVFHVRGGESHSVRRFVESTVAGLAASAVLTGQLAEQSKDDGLDFAAFDCASCHHNLKYPSDRQERGYLGVAGRPLFRPANFALTKAVLKHAATLDKDVQASYDALLVTEKQLLESFKQKSLGDTDKVMKATAGIKQWADQTVAKLSKVKYDAAASKSLLADLIALGQQPIADPEVAQLYLWGVETLALAGVDTKTVTELPKPLADLGAKLKPYVVTRLRDDNRYPFEVKPGGSGPKMSAVDARIGERMEVFNNFKFLAFKKGFEEFPLGK